MHVRMRGGQGGRRRPAPSAGAALLVALAVGLAGCAAAGPAAPRAGAGGPPAASTASPGTTAAADSSASAPQAPASSSSPAASSAPGSSAARSAPAAPAASAPSSGTASTPAAPPASVPAAPASPSSASSAASPARSPGASGVPAFSHVFIIVMENLGYGGAIALPYVSTLAAHYAVATAYDSVAHPSLPNYLALTSGNTWVTSDCFSCYQSAPNLASEAAAAGVSWGGYMEGLPSPCFLGPFNLATNYAGKHDPFRYYNDVRSSSGLCGGIQPLTNLEALLPPGPAAAGASPAGSAAGSASAPSAGAAGALAARIPRLTWITPNLCNDGHNCSATKADAWLSTFVPRILASPAWQNGGVLFITWDESYGGDRAACCGIPSGQGGGHILTLVIAPGLAAGMRVSVPYDHYSLLATVEDGLGLPLLGHAATATPMSAFWASGGGA